MLEYPRSDDLPISLYINKGITPISDVSAHSYQLEPWIDLQPHLDGLEVISLGLGPDAALYVLAIVPPAQYREQRAGASFARIQPSKPNTFVVLQCDAYAVNRMEISNQS